MYFRELVVARFKWDKMKGPSKEKTFTNNAAEVLIETAYPYGESFNVRKKRGCLQRMRRLFRTFFNAEKWWGNRKKRFYGEIWENAI